MYAQTYNVFPFTVVYISPSKELEEIIEQVGYCFNSFSIYNLHVKMLINNSLYHSGFLFLNVWYEESPIARQGNVHTLQIQHWQAHSKLCTKTFSSDFDLPNFQKQNFKSSETEHRSQFITR